MPNNCVNECPNGTIIRNNKCILEESNDDNFNYMLMNFIIITIILLLIIALFIYKNYYKEKKVMNYTKI